MKWKEYKVLSEKTLSTEFHCGKQVENLLLQSCQLEITFMNKDKIVAESLEDETKYEIGGE